VALGIIDLRYLEKHMESKKISKSKLANLIGVDYVTVYRVFKKQRNPGTKFIAGLLNNNLDIDLQKIFLNTSLPNGKTQKERS